MKILYIECNYYDYCKPQFGHLHTHTHTHFTSEPYLTDENNTPPQSVRKGSQRRPNASASVYSPGEDSYMFHLIISSNTILMLKIICIFLLMLDLLLPIGHQ